MSGPGVAGLALLVAAAAMPAVAAEALVYRCTNPASGVSWEIRVDLAHNRVDAFPAEIDAHSIRWHDTAAGGFYDLDRATGELTMRNASSTGGYFLHDQCRAR
ncbi:MAG: hypothetical protein ACREE2_08795 [Stellaceae bacterium]